MIQFHFEPANIDTIKTKFHDPWITDQEDENARQFRNRDY